MEASAKFENEDEKNFIEREMYFGSATNNFRRILALQISDLIFDR